MDKKTLVLIIGAMKSGTTSLYSYIGQHPKICKSNINEPNYFSKEEVYEKGLKWYLNNFNRYNECSHLLEASTSYTKSLNGNFAPKRVQDLGCIFNIKLIYLIRNPVKKNSKSRLVPSFQITGLHTKNK